MWRRVAKEEEEMLFPSYLPKCATALSFSRASEKFYPVAVRILKIVNALHTVLVAWHKCWLDTFRYEFPECRGWVSYFEFDVIEDLQVISIFPHGTSFPLLTLSNREAWCRTREIFQDLLL